jgi:formylglycine-generating enzyme required for sulfatase activity
VDALAMMHDGFLYDFPGRRYELRHADVDGWFNVALDAMRAFAQLVEPVVVEAELGDIGEPTTVHHLVAPDAKGGAYERVAEHTTTVDAIHATAIEAWLSRITQNGNLPVAHISSADGWYAVNARSGDVVRLRAGTSTEEIVVVEHRGVPCVSAPNERVLVPPFAFGLDCLTNTLQIKLHWSPWIDGDGVGRTRFTHLLNQLATAGWTTAQAPSAQDLDWRAWLPSASITALPTRPVDDSWIELPATRITIGLTDDERERLVEMLLAIDREDHAAEQPLGFTSYDQRARREDIRKALATSLGRHEVAVERCQIMRRPVTNAMWGAYMKQTGAARPTTWSDTASPAADAPVTGISQQEARTFAEHHGWRLPSEAEWELAATGGVHRWFPWGAWSPRGAALDRGPVPPAVGRQQDLASPLGVEDLLGGTAEYTSDRFAPYPGAELAAFVQVAGDVADQCCLRGLAPKSPPCIPARRGLPSTYRFKFARFRCVRDA